MSFDIDSASWTGRNDPFKAHEELRKEILRQQEIAEMQKVRMAPPGAAIGVWEGSMQGYPINTPPRVYSLREKMEMRMNWQPGTKVEGFSHMDYHVAGDKAFVWIVTNAGQSIVLEDEAALFPSDALITKVRMMGG